MVGFDKEERTKELIEKYREQEKAENGYLKRTLSVGKLKELALLSCSMGSCNEKGLTKDGLRGLSKVCVLFFVVA